jgi:hypothetical protein
MLFKRQMKIRVEVNVLRNAKRKQDALAHARYSLFAVILVLSLAGVSMAQTGSATLRVSVEDPNKATVPQANVTLTSERTGEQRQAETNNDGSVTFASLTPGMYKLRVEAPNFKTAEQGGISIDPNATRGMDIQLEIGRPTEVVNVTATQDEIQTETGAKENTITAAQIENLSIVSRSSLELLKILPGVVAPGSDEAGFQSTSFNSGANANNAYHVNGLRGENNSVSIDGSRVIDIGANNGTIITANPDMVSEVKVQTSNYAAEHGTSGVQITATTKGGGQGFHGAIYDYIRSHKMNANDRSRSSNNIARSPESYQYPGGNIGGPVFLPSFGEGGKPYWNGKDKLFFFFGLEFQRQQVDPGTSFARVPTAAQRTGQGFFNRNNSNFNDSSNNPAIINQAAFNLTPAQIDPIGTSLLNLYPLPNFTDPNCSTANQVRAQCNNYAFTGLQPVNRTQATLRFDYKVNNSVSAWVRLARESEEQDYARGLWWSPSAYELPSHVLGTNLGRSASVGITAVLNPTMTNEVVLSASKLLLDNDYRDPSKVSLGSLGLNNLVGPFGQLSKYAPLSLITSWSGQTSGDLWEPGALPLFAHNASYSVYDNLTKVSGAHTLKFGGVLERATKAQNFQGSPEGMFIYAPWGSGSTGDVFADILAGAAAQYNQGQPAVKGSFRLYNYEFYAQDSFKVKSNFTLEYGVRMAYFPNNEEVNSRGVVFDPKAYDRTQGVLVNGDRNKPNGILTAASGAIPKGYTDNPPLQIMPRLNFAWDIGGKGDTVIRGGGGVFYNRVQGNYQYYVIQQPPNAFCGQQDGCGFGAGNFAGSGSIYGRLNTIDPFTQLGTVNLTTASLDSVEVPRVANASLTFERRLPFKNVLTVGYVGTFGRHLPTSRNINTIPAGRLLSGTVGNADLSVPVNRVAVANQANVLAQFRPFPAYGTITQNEYVATSAYHSLQATLSRQLGNNLTYFATYTFSKALGTTAVNETGSGIDPVDARNRTFGILPFDRTHVFNISYNYVLPKLARGSFENKFTGGVLNGWQVSGISTYSSGIPIYLRFAGAINNQIALAAFGTDGFTTSGASSGGIAPVFRGDPSINGGSSLNNKMFDLGQLGIPAFGTSGPFQSPFYMRSPHRINHDVTVFKNFKIGEEKKLQFRAAFFNIFNQAYPRWVAIGDANNDINTVLNTSCNRTLNGIPNGTTSGTSDNVCDPTGGFSFTQDTVDNFGKITRKRGHRIVELALKFSF